MDAGLDGPAWDALRAEGAWMRRLARALVGDGPAADDLVQDAWRRIAEQHGKGQHGERRPTRAWLAGMLRFLARERRRADGRRVRREREAARPEAVPGVDELGARLELQRGVLDAVRALPREQRDAILLRYYDELSPTEIARRLGVPAGTVRARLSRGLAELRRRLDERSGGERAEWQLALAPWVAGRGVVRGGALALGGVAVKLGLGAAVLCLALLVALSSWWAEPTGRGPIAMAPGSELTGVPGARRAETAADEWRDPARSDAAGFGLAPREQPNGAGPSTAPTTARFAARVLDRGGRALRSAWMLAEHGGATQRASADAAGRIELALSSPFADVIALHVGAPGHATERIQRAPLPGGLRWIGDVRLAPGAALVGRVVDAAGQPMPDAEVLATPVFRIESAHREWMQLNGDREPALATTRTDLDGSFRFAGLPVGHVRIWARATARRWTFSSPISLSAGGEGGELVLALANPDPSAWISGVLLEPGGAPVQGAYVNWQVTAGSHETTERITGTDADGRFELPVLGPGARRLIVHDREHRYAPLSLDGVIPGAALVLRFEPEPRLGLRVLDTDARPIAGADVRAQLVRNDETGSSATTDEEGRAELRVPGAQFELVAQAVGFQPARIGPFSPAALPQDATLHLKPATSVRGRVAAGGAPLAGAQVSLHRSAQGGPLPVLWTGGAGALRLRLDPHPSVRATSDARGEFALTIGESDGGGAWFVRSVMDGHAHALVGPLELDPVAGREGLVLEHGPGGALEGRLILPPDTEPAGYMARAANSDGVVLERELGPDGRYRFEALLPGAWQLAAFEPGAAFHPGLSQPALAGNVAACIDVRAGSTTRADIDLSDQLRHVLAGRLVLRGAALGAWSVSGSSRDQRVWTQLDPEGGFELEFEHPGEVTLGFTVEDEENDHLAVVDRVQVTGPRTEWRLELEVGFIAGWADGDWVTYEWGQLQAPPFAKMLQPLAKDGSFGPALVPAGPGFLLTGELEPFGREPERATHAHLIDVPVGEELGVDLR